MICPHCQREIADNSNFCYFCGSRQHAVGIARKRLMRSAIDNKLAGVCGGFAEYLDVDPTIVRLAWILITLFTGLIPGLVTYFIAWMIMPLAPVPMVAQAQPAAQQTAPQG